MNAAAGSREAAARPDLVPALDGLRALAALVVVVRHALLTVGIPPELDRRLCASPLALLLNATGAVHVFFALSGYVLAQSALRDWTVAGVAQFWLRRAFRLHPPYVAAVLFAWLVSHAFVVTAPSGGLSPWHAMLAGVSIPATRLPRLLLYPSAADGLLLTGWTLALEAVYSAALPLMLLLARRLHWSVLLLGFAGGLFVPGPGFTFYSLRGTLLCSLDFVLGVAAFLERERLARWVEAHRRLATVGLAAAGALYAAPLALGWRPYGVAATTAMAVGAGGLVAAAAFLPGLRRWLAQPALVRLGRISYSFYLVHLPLAVAVAPALVTPPATLADAALTIALVTAASLGLAAAGYRWVERPAIAAGRRLCGILARHARRLLAAPPGPW